MLRVQFQTKCKTDFTLCPRGCTQRRTRRNRLAEKRTFDGKKCHKCHFEIKKGYSQVIFEKFRSH